MTFKTTWNATAFPVYGKRFTLPSLTVPDQSMTVKQIADRYIRGLPIGGEKVAIYESRETDDFEDMLPDLANLDISERFELSAVAKAEYEALKVRLREQNAKRTQDIIKKSEERLKAFIDKHANEKAKVDPKSEGSAK